MFGKTNAQNGFTTYSVFPNTTLSFYTTKALLIDNAGNKWVGFTAIDASFCALAKYTNGNGTCPKKAFRANHNSTVESLPMDQSITSDLNSR